jgi:hypothetical protein
MRIPGFDGQRVPAEEAPFEAIKALRQIGHNG